MVFSELPESNADSGSHGVMTHLRARLTALRSRLSLLGHRRACGELDYILDAAFDTGLRRRAEELLATAGPGLAKALTKILEETK